MNWFRLKTCIKCQGDLAADDGDWICLQCGTYYYTGLYQLHPHIDDEPDSNQGPSEQPEKKHLFSLPAHPALMVRSAAATDICLAADTGAAFL